MRVLQLIDSLRPGGAEKMAVNIANALVPHVEGSFLCCTRQEGFLKDELKPGVRYVFLNKKSSLDLKAILKLRKFIRKNKIDIVHAHGTSYFLAGILKLSGSRFKLIWHNHYGASENWKGREFMVLKMFSRYFAGIITVNGALKEWAVKKLDCKYVVEIKNFIPKSDFSAGTKLRLKGNKDAFKIICVANLRPDKDHFNLLKAFELVRPELRITLHLVGADPKSSYSQSVLEAIENSIVTHKIFYYGTQVDILSLLKQVNLGVLSSRSEGLPLAMIEYGMAGLPVVCTNVGQCAELIGENGRIVPPENPESLSAAINFYFENPENALKDGISLQRRVEEIFSGEMIISDFISFYLKVSIRI